MQTPSTQSNHAPHAFIKKHQADVTGILQGFDRLRLQGTLRSLYHPASMEAYLQLGHVLWKDFMTFTTGIHSADTRRFGRNRPCCWPAFSLSAFGELTQRG